MSDEQDQAEAFDPDEIGDDPEGDLQYPPEHRLGVEDRDPDDALVPDFGVDTATDDEPEPAVARLVSPDEDDDVPGGVDDESNAVAWAPEQVEVDLSAEEAAVHLTDDPPFD